MYYNTDWQRSAQCHINIWYTLVLGLVLRKYTHGHHWVWARYLKHDVIHASYNIIQLIHYLHNTLILFSLGVLSNESSRKSLGAFVTSVTSPGDRSRRRGDDEWRLTATVRAAVMTTSSAFCRPFAPPRWRRVAPPVDRPLDRSAAYLGGARRPAGGPLPATEEDVAEGGAEVAVEQRVDTRVDAWRDVAEPREGGEQRVGHVARRAQSVRQVGAEERQPEADEADEHPHEGLFGASLAAVRGARGAAVRQHVEVAERSGGRGRGWSRGRGRGRGAAERAAQAPGQLAGGRREEAAQAADAERRAGRPVVPGGGAGGRQRRAAERDRAGRTRTDRRRSIAARRRGHAAHEVPTQDEHRTHVRHQHHRQRHEERHHRRIHDERALVDPAVQRARPRVRP